MTDLVNDENGEAVSAPTTDPEHFKPRGTVVILVMFVVTLILLWLTVYLILLSRGVTV